MACPVFQRAQSEPEKRNDVNDVVGISPLWFGSSLSMPYVAGTAGHSVLELALGCNGAGRVGHVAGSWARAGRLFVDPMASLISFLLPAAILSVLVLRSGLRSRCSGSPAASWLSGCGGPAKSVLPRFT